MSAPGRGGRRRLLRAMGKEEVGALKGFLVLQDTFCKEILGGYRRYICNLADVFVVRREMLGNYDALGMSAPMMGLAREHHEYNMTLLESV